MAWPLIDPDNEFSPNWHIQMMCDYLENTLARSGKSLKIGRLVPKLRNLVLNIPLRCGKSSVFVAYIAWMWISSPSKKFAYVSNSYERAIDITGKARDLISSRWYQERWPIYFSRTQNTKEYFKNSEKGFVQSFGVDSGITGGSYDVIIADDLNKANEIYSDAHRNKVINNWQSTISNRAANPKTCVRIVCQQRLHTQDLSGFILDGPDKENWDNLVLPMEFEPDRFKCKFADFKDPRTTPGELLWPSRYGPEEIQTLKNDFSEQEYASQCQCRPTLAVGNIFKKEWFINRLENFPITRRFISVDTAQSIKASADPTAIVVGELNEKYELFIRDVINKRLDFVDLQNEVEKIANAYSYGLMNIVVESKSSGLSLVQSMRKTSPDWMKDLLFPWNPAGDKILRYNKITRFCEKGMVFLPQLSDGYPWLEEFEDQLFKVPNCAHDDMADSFSQLLEFLNFWLEEGLSFRNRKE